MVATPRTRNSASARRARPQALVALGLCAWRAREELDERTVDVHVGRLRKALNRGREADPIRTVRGAGYALDDRFGRSAA